jgi:hypothetical protein
MLRARIARSLALGAVLAGCAPRAVFRQAQPGGQDGGQPLPDALPVFVPDVRPAADAPVAPAPAPLDASPPAPDLGPPPDTAPPAPKNALLVVGTLKPLLGDDLKLRMRLEGKGLVVKLAGDSEPGTAAMGFDLVVVSGSSVANMVAGKYQGVAIPVVCLEPAITGPMKLTANGPNGSGTTATTQIVITNPMHPIAAGLSGTVTVMTMTSMMSQLSWATPAATATQIATLVNAPTRATVYAYEKGTMMVGAVAPARRVGLFVHVEVPSRLTEDGWKIFDAAVDWALAPPP